MRISDWSSDVCSSDLPLVNQAVDGILAMALQLPAVQKLGQEIGIDIADGLGGIARAAEKPFRPEPAAQSRSEERRVGKEGVSTGRTLWSPCTEKKKKYTLISTQLRHKEQK